MLAVLFILKLLIMSHDMQVYMINTRRVDHQFNRTKMKEDINNFINGCARIFYFFEGLTGARFVNKLRQIILFQGACYDRCQSFHKYGKM